MGGNPLSYLPFFLDTFPPTLSAQLTVTAHYRTLQDDPFPSLLSPSVQKATLRRLPTSVSPSRPITAPQPQDWLFVTLCAMMLLATVLLNGHLFLNAHVAARRHLLSL